MRTSTDTRAAPEQFDRRGRMFLSPDFGLTSRELSKYRLSRLLLAAAYDRARQDAGFEVECHEFAVTKYGLRTSVFNEFFIPGEILKRDLLATSGPAGGYLVDTVVGEMVAAKYPRSWAFNLPTQMPGQKANFTLPRHNSGVAVTWLTNEGSTQITERTPDIGGVSFAPKTVATLVERSRQHFLQVSEANDAAITRALVAAVSSAVDVVALNGTGASGQPLGLLNVSGIASQAGAAISWAGVLEMLRLVEVAAADVGGGIAWLVAPDAAKILRAREKSAGSGFILEQGPAGESIAGHPAYVSTAVPNGTLVLGSWWHAVLAQWGGLSVAVTPFGSPTNFKAGLISVRAIVSVDFGVTHAAAFTKAESVS